MKVSRAGTGSHGELKDWLQDAQFFLVFIENIFRKRQCNEIFKENKYL